MSEPVGNTPRRAMDIPGNSHKEREAKPPLKQDKAETPREPVQKIVEGKVVRHKQPWYRRMARNLIADDAQNIGDYVVAEVLVPALRNLIRDSIFGVTDRALYGSVRSRRSYGRVGERESLRTRYDLMSDRGDRGEPRRTMSREARARHDFDDIILDDLEEANAVIETLVDRVARYRSATVADLYDLLGTTGSYADRSYGWTDLRTADVRQSRGGWMLDLPQPIVLR